MWKRGGRSTALERAEALLKSRKRATNTDTVVNFDPNDPSLVPPKPLTFDLSCSSGSEEGVGVLGSSGVQKPVEGSQSRFTKKGPTTAPSAQPRYLKSSHHSFAFSPLAQTQNQNHIPRTMQNNLDLGISAAGTQLAESDLDLSGWYSPDQALNQTTFLKNPGAGPAVILGPPRNQSEDTSAPVGRVTVSANNLGRVSLDSDEEDMKRLLDQSEGCSSTANSRRPGPVGLRRTTQVPITHSPKVMWPSGPTVYHPQPSDPTGPAPPPGDPSAFSSPSASFSPQGALSLNELFPVDLQSHDSCSQMTSATSQDFRVNVMALDDLVPGFSDQTKEKNPCVSPGVLEEEQEVLDYHSDFDPVTWTEPSTSKISEHILGSEVREEVVSEVREEVGSEVREDVCDPGPNSSFRTSDSRWNTEASSTEAQGACTCGRSLKDPGLGDVWNSVPQFMHESGLSSSSSTLVLLQMFKHQLTLTRTFMENNRRLHWSLIQSLEPPNYRYISLKNQNISLKNHNQNQTTGTPVGTI